MKSSKAQDQMWHGAEPLPATTTNTIYLTPDEQLHLSPLHDTYNSTTQSYLCHSHAPCTSTLFSCKPCYSSSPCIVGLQRSVTWEVTGRVCSINHRFDLINCMENDLGEGVWWRAWEDTSLRVNSTKLVYKFVYKSLVYGGGRLSLIKKKLFAGGTDSGLVKMHPTLYFKNRINHW